MVKILHCGPFSTIKCYIWARSVEKKKKKTSIRYGSVQWQNATFGPNQCNKFYVKASGFLLFFYIACVHRIEMSSSGTMTTLTNKHQIHSSAHCLSRTTEQCCATIVCKLLCTVVQKSWVKSSSKLKTQ